PPPPPPSKPAPARGTALERPSVSLERTAPAATPAAPQKDDGRGPPAVSGVPAAGDEFGDDDPFMGLLRSKAR
ncbi:hypothetical protein HK405_012729, partial [Cladochytrium tenue]